MRDNTKSSTPQPPWPAEVGRCSQRCMRCLKQQLRNEQTRDWQRDPKRVARQQNLVLGRLVGFSPPFVFVRRHVFSCLCRYSAFTRSFGPPTYYVFFSFSLFVSSCASILSLLSSIASASPVSAIHSSPKLCVR